MPSPYPVSVAGESFNNADGSSRQEELRRCLRGETVTLIPEPDNPHDANCIRVMSARGIQIGNVARHHAEWLAEILDRQECQAIILGGGEAASGLVGISLLVSTDDEPPSIERFDRGDYTWLDDQPYE